ncbi:MAG TPA: NAD(P)/FAD-dependent oxidoreductase [Anaeromyxobacteraceae bacterium]|nr:NAD(P)/FAD-dependent oxidoreductase [Anaeromyxobacteraceae bacterium]
MSATGEPTARAGRGRPVVAIVGAGFAGLHAARALRRAPVQIVLLDRRNHHLFQPLLYQVATAALNPADIAAPIRAVLRRQHNCEVLLADVQEVDVAHRRLVADGFDLAYDWLVVATGAGHSYFGHPEWAPLAPGLKTIEDALDIRRRLLGAFEMAEREPDPERRRAWLTFVVVGAGPTGVELAGAIGDIARTTLARDFRHFSPASARVILLEGTPRVLPPYPPDLSDAARRQLEAMGVEVRTGAMVTAIDGDGVTAGGERIDARTVLWGAGVAASPLGRSLGAPLDRSGRVRVEPDLSVPGHPEVLVAGDLAAATHDGKPVPGVAPAAMQMGRHAADDIRRDLAGEPRRPFRYHDKGSLASLGRAAAVAQLGKWHVSGRPAWLLWVFVHVLYLVGFRNRVAVMLQWFWAYVTRGSRGARLITYVQAAPPPQVAVRPPEVDGSPERGRPPEAASESPTVH